ncbi:MAG: ABC transporter permease [Fidelibacterota bacterium]
MIKFLVKGLIRDRQRSVFPIIMVTVGVWITVFLHSWITGVFTDMVDYSARFSTGHVKVMTRAYAENADQSPNDLALMNVEEIILRLQEKYPNMTWVKRIQFGGLFDIPDENGDTRSQGSVMGMGIDLLSPGSPEITTMNIKKSVVRGRLPERPGEILISDELAYRLEAEIGNEGTLLSSTMYGNMTMYNFNIVGTVNFGVAVMDRGALIADITDVQEALNMTDAAGEILGYFEHGIYDDLRAQNIVDNFNSTYQITDDEFTPVIGTLKEVGNLGEYLEFASSISGIIISIFVIIMSIVLWNAGLLGALRRYGEVGIRLAIGERKGHIYRSMIYESIFIGIVGSVIGTALGLSSGYYLQIKGLDLSSMMKNVTMMAPVVYRASVTTETYYIGFFPGLLATIIGTMFAGIGIFKRQTAELFKELET